MALQYIILRNQVTEDICNQIVQAFKLPSTPRELNLPNDTDKGDVVYASKRSKGLYYKYLVWSKHLGDLIVHSLNKATGLNFEDSINKLCLPIFAYKEGGEIKAHRGTQKEQKTINYQEYVAVLQLTQRDIDFTDGRFYLNPIATASEDGKTVYNDKPEDRYYPMLNKGDIIIFHNPSLVHGVETVTGFNALRVTCSWRTNSSNQF